MCRQCQAAGHIYRMCWAEKQACDFKMRLRESPLCVLVEACAVAAELLRARIERSISCSLSDRGGFLLAQI